MNELANSLQNEIAVLSEQLIRAEANVSELNRQLEHAREELAKASATRAPRMRNARATQAEK
jgi:molecular chaperone GrpE (heat shock protein)